MEMSLIGNDDNDPTTLKIHLKISKTLSYKENWLLFLAETPNFYNCWSNPITGNLIKILCGAQVISYSV